MGRKYLVHSHSFSLTPGVSKKLPGIRIRVLWLDPDPNFEMKSDPVFEIWSDLDPVSKTWNIFCRKKKIKGKFY